MKLELARGGWRGAVDTHGGELVSWRDEDGTEYLWNGDPAYWKGRNPVLFPIVGGLKGGQVGFEGRTYQMSRHGFARDCQFVPTEQGEDHVVLELRENAETLSRYPYPFALRVRHQLLDQGFTTTFEVENTGDSPMPFCIGAHTAFRCPLAPEERFEDYDIVFDQPEEGNTLLLTPEGTIRPGQTEPILRGTDRFALDRTLFARLDTVIFQGLRSRSVRLLNRNTGRGVRMDFDGFPMVAFWTKGDAPFICLEPWHGCAALEDESGDFLDKPMCIRLSPGEKKTLSYTVVKMR